MITGREKRGAGKERPKRTCLSQDQGKVSEPKGAWELMKTGVNQASVTSGEDKGQRPLRAGKHSHINALKSQEEGVLGRGCRRDVWA